jgi:hypothetical protein
VGSEVEATSVLVVVTEEEEEEETVDMENEEMGTVDEEVDLELELELELEGCRSVLMRLVRCSRQVQHSFKMMGHTRTSNSTRRLTPPLSAKRTKS